jgi:group I intron endonuclease
MPSMFKVYLIQNIENGKVYVGKTSKTLTQRWNNHVKSAHFGSSYYFHNAIRKYSPEMFKIRQIDEVETNEQACERETYWITQIFKSNLRENGYNSTVGGDGAPIGNTYGLGRPCTEETKRKIAIAQKGRPFSEEHKKALCVPKQIKPSIETRQKWSLSRKGEKNNNFGKHLSEETKQKISITLKGKPWSIARRAAQKDGSHSIY